MRNSVLLLHVQYGVVDQKTCRIMQDRKSHGEKEWCNARRLTVTPVWPTAAADRKEERPLLVSMAMTKFLSVSASLTLPLPRVFPSYTQTFSLELPCVIPDQPPSSLNYLCMGVCVCQWQCMQIYMVNTFVIWPNKEEGKRGDRLAEAWHRSQHWE